MNVSVCFITTCKCSEINNIDFCIHHNVMQLVILFKRYLLSRTDSVRTLEVLFDSLNTRTIYEPDTGSITSWMCIVSTPKFGLKI